MARVYFFEAALHKGMRAISRVMAMIYAAPVSLLGGSFRVLKNLLGGRAYGKLVPSSHAPYWGFGVWLVPCLNLTLAGMQHEIPSGVYEITRSGPGTISIALSDLSSGSQLTGQVANRFAFLIVDPIREPVFKVASSDNFIALGDLELRRLTPLNLALRARLARRCGVRRLAELVLRQDLDELLALAREPPSSDVVNAASETTSDMQSGGAPSDAMSYRAWIDAFEPERERNAEMARDWLAQRGVRLQFSIVMAAYQSDPVWLDRAVSSVIAQAYPHWRLIIVDDGSPDPRCARAVRAQQARDSRIEVVRRSENGGIAIATNDAIARAEGDWIVFMDHDDMLSIDALAVCAAAISDHPNAELVYTDEDKIDDEDRRYDPYFKPDFDRELLYGQNYFNHLTAIRADRVRSIGGLRADLDGSQDYDLVLRCVEAAPEAAIIHAPFVCYHWRFTKRRSNYSLRHAERATAAARAALTAHFARAGIDARVDAAWSGSGYHRVVRAHAVPISADVKATIVICGDGKPDQLRHSVERLLARSGEMSCDFVVLDDGREDRDRAKMLRGLTQRGVAHAFRTPARSNLGESLNLAIAQARGDFVAIFSSVILDVSSDWLVEMARPFVHGEVSAVGARLVSPTGEVAHSGIVLGLDGLAGHPYRRHQRYDGGPFGRFRLAHEVAALTTNAIVVRRSSFNAVGGFDADIASPLLRDIDFFMKLRSIGERIIEIPHVEFFVGAESVSRGVEDSPEKQARFEREVRVMLDRWGARLTADPYWSPNLDLQGDQGALAWPPRVRRPWSDAPD